MGKPAARIGDQTAHGGAIVKGFPTVLIGGMPAARVNDMHVCPMVTALVPHVGGPIALGSAGVLIGGMPAARVGDMVVCVGPPDTIVMGCPTVLIGETGGGAGGGGGGGSATMGALRSALVAGKAPPANQVGDHFLDVTFVDGAELPIGGVSYELTYPDKSARTGQLNGRVKIAGIPQGNYKITLRSIVNAQWSVKEADVGDSVKLTVETLGVKNGEKATLEICIRDSNYSDHLLTSIETTVKNDSINQEWKLEVDEKFLKICEEKGEYGRYSLPFFFFCVTIGELTERSGLLFYKDWVEIEVFREDGKPAANEEFFIYFSSGEIRKQKLDQNGKAKIDKTIPTVSRIDFPNLPHMTVKK